MPLILFGVALVGQILGAVLRGAPSDTDAVISAAVPVGAFLTFIFWAASVLAWGSALSVFLKLSELKWLGAVSLGTAGAALAYL